MIYYDKYNFARKATAALGDPHEPTSSALAVSKAQVFAILDLAQAFREVANIPSEDGPLDKDELVEMREMLEWFRRTR